MPKILKLKTPSPIGKNTILDKIINHIEGIPLKGKRVLLICDDNTRDTPISMFFKDFVEFLRTKTVMITILFALGTHRPMTKKEMKIKLGMSDSQLDGIELLNHDPLDTNKLVYVGKIALVPLKVNRAIADNDVVLAFSGVIPHRIMGFSGGAKILCPGIANKEMIDFSHRESNLYPEEKIMAQIENPMRDLLDKIAKKITKKYHKKFISVNIVSLEKNIFGIFVGDFFSSYRQAAKLSQSIFIHTVEECSSILAVLDDKCLDFWQAAKAVYNCGRVIKKGGKIVVTGKLSEGISSTHGSIIEKFGYSTPKKIHELIQNGMLTDTLVASHMVRVSQHLENIDIFLSSENLLEETCKKVNLGYLHPTKISEKDFNYVIYNPVDLVLKTVEDL